MQELYHESVSRKCEGLLDEQTIREKSVIYTKNPTAYQAAVNNASFDLCTKDPSLLFRKKGDLKTLAEERANETYVFKKGHSRSKRYAETSTSQETDPKKKKITTDERQARIKEVCEEISSIYRRIDIREQGITQATNSRDFLMCKNLTDEVSELKSQRKMLNAELASLQQKEKKSKEYHKRKKSRTVLSNESMPETTEPEDPPFQQGLPTSQ